MPIEIPDPPFEDQTEEVIRERMFAALTSGLDTSEGSMAWNLISPLAIELAEVWTALDQAVELSFAQTAYGKFLDARAEEYGVYRQEEAVATGTVVFSGANGTVPKGTRVGNTVLIGDIEEPVVFTTDTDAVISGGSAPPVGVTAEVAGKASNLPIGGIDRMVDSVGIVTSVTNDTPTEGGRDEEDDETFRKRFFSLTSDWKGAGSANDYRVWAMEASTAVWKVDVIPGAAPAVDIYLFDSDYTGVGATEVQKVSDYIADVRPLGANVTVNDGVTDPVAVSINVDFEAGFVEANVIDACQEAVQEYIDTLETDEVVRQSKIEGAIANLVGIANVVSSTINAVNSDYTPAAGSLMRMSTFDLT